jgi:hypothetical protein
MPEVNHEWVKKQLEAAKVKIGSGKAVLQLLSVWENFNLSGPMSRETIEVFSKLALNQAIDLEEVTEEVWIALQPGNILVGDEVRVFPDAFEGNLGPTHNGRRGTVVAVRYGDVIFNATDGKLPELKGVHYSPYKLEKRIK